MTVDDLVTWLRAQLDDDARLIDEYEAYMAERAAAAGSYVPVIPPGWQPGEPFDPDRQRADVDAKRRILDAHPFESGIVGGVCGTCRGAGRIEEYWDGEEETVEHVDTEMPWPCPTVRLLAPPYADRPGYRPEWAPNA